MSHVEFAEWRGHDRDIVEYSCSFDLFDDDRLCFIQPDLFTSATCCMARRAVGDLFAPVATLAGGLDQTLVLNKPWPVLPAWMHQRTYLTGEFLMQARIPCLSSNDNRTAAPRCLMVRAQRRCDVQMKLGFHIHSRSITGAQQILLTTTLIAHITALCSRLRRSGNQSRCRGKPSSWKCLRRSVSAWPLLHRVYAIAKPSIASLPVFGVHIGTYAVPCTRIGTTPLLTLWCSRR